MKFLNTMLIQCLLALLLSTANRSNAADTPEKKPARTVAEPNASFAWQRRIPEYNSDALPLGEVIQYLRQHFPEINFLIKQQGDTDGDVGSISVRMELRAVTLKE